MKNRWHKKEKSTDDYKKITFPSNKIEIHQSKEEEHIMEVISLGENTAITTISS